MGLGDSPQRRKERGGVDEEGGAMGRGASHPLARRSLGEGGSHRSYAFQNTDYTDDTQMAQMGFL